jgi:TatD DNase family protein
MLIDTHCHLYLDDFKEDIQAVLERADKESVHKFYLPAISSNETKAMLELEKMYPGKCIAMMGLHPCYVKEDYKRELDNVQQWLQQRKFAAVGEIGLDFYHDKTFMSQQYEAFQTQIDWALQYKLPIVIHTRNAMQQTIDVVTTYKLKELRGIFHCFSGSYEDAVTITELGFYLGIGGVITYKNSGLSEVIEKIPLKFLVLETDAPYLTPVPFRGKRNESSYLKYIVAKIAEIKNVTIEEVAEITSQNAEKIFGG